MNRCPTTCLLWLLFLICGGQIGHAKLKPEEVPTFELRARVVKIADRQPAAAKQTFSFRFGAPSNQVRTEGGQWSDWLKFESEQIEATLKGYPALYMNKYNTTITVNGELSPADRLLKTGDRIVFLPVIGGG